MSTTRTRRASGRPLIAVEGELKELVVYECKVCDKVSKDVDTLYDHVEEHHRVSKGRNQRSSPGKGGPRSKAMLAVLSASVQKTVYNARKMQLGDTAPEYHFMVSNGDEL